MDLREMIPTQNRLVIELPEIDEKAGESGLIFKPTSLSDREDMSRCSGTVVAKGPYAFEQFPLGQPQIGDYVMCVQYAGTFFQDTETGKGYRVINDSEVLSIVPKSLEVDRYGL